MDNSAPICLFTYNRLSETRQTVKALQANFLAKESDLIIFSDGAKDEQANAKVIELREFLKTINGFKSIIINESTHNRGLANSIIRGVSQVVEQYGQVIVLEDDLMTTPNFLDFMNQALKYYQESKQIQSINGYSLKIHNDQGVYFHQRTFPWGWATWKDRWSQDLFDKDVIQQKIQSDQTLLPSFNKACGNDISAMLQGSLSGANNSWYVRWVFDHFMNKTYAVYPTLSKVTNIGFVAEGTHCTGINTYISETDQDYQTNFIFNDYQTLDPKANTQFLTFFKKTYKLLFRVKLLLSSSGRTEIKKEIMSKFF